MTTICSPVKYEDFQRLDIRTGTIVSVEGFLRAYKPAYRVSVDFGDELGQKGSSVQATNYEKSELMGMQVLCVVNLPAKNIAGFSSEVLVLGVPGEDGQLSLVTPSRKARPGGRLF
jgi:tRNA-binding protein